MVLKINENKLERKKKKISSLPTAGTVGIYIGGIWLYIYTDCMVCKGP
jgi:hypothetical protein